MSVEPRLGHGRNAYLYDFSKFRRDPLEYFKSYHSALSEFNKEETHIGALKLYRKMIPNFLLYFNTYLQDVIIRKLESRNGLYEEEEIGLKCLHLTIDFMIDNCESLYQKKNVGTVINALCEWLHGFEVFPRTISTGSPCRDITEAILICLCKCLWQCRLFVKYDKGTFAQFKELSHYIESCFTSPQSSEKMKLAAAIIICLIELVDEELVYEACEYLGDIVRQCGFETYLGFDIRMIREISLFEECITSRNDSTLIRKLKILESELKSRDKIIENSTSEIVKLREEIRSLKSEVNGKDEIINDLKNEMDRKNKEQGAKVKEYSELTKTINKQLGDRKLEIEQLNNELKGKQEKIVNLKSKVKRKEETIEKLAETVHSVTKDLRVRGEEIRNLKLELRSKDETIKDINSENERKIKEHSDLTKTNDAELLKIQSDAEKSKRELEMRIEELRNSELERKCKDEAIETLTKTIKELNQSKEAGEKVQEELLNDVIMESDRYSYLMNVYSAVICLWIIFGQTNMSFFQSAVFELERRESEYSDLVNDLIETILRDVPVEQGNMEIVSLATPEGGHTVIYSVQVWNLVFHLMN